MQGHISNQGPEVDVDQAARQPEMASHSSATTAGEQSFDRLEAATSWLSNRSGQVFKKGNRGLGYYADCEHSIDGFMAATAWSGHKPHYVFRSGQRLGIL